MARLRSFSTEGIVAFFFSFFPTFLLSLVVKDLINATANPHAFDCSHMSVCLSPTVSNCRCLWIAVGCVRACLRACASACMRAETEEASNTRPCLRGLRTKLLTWVVQDFPRVQWLQETFFGVSLDSVCFMQMHTIRPHLHACACMCTDVFFFRVCFNFLWKRAQNGDVQVKSQLVHLLFVLGASLGNETFYILALPFTFWAVNMVLLRQIILVWAVLYYTGQTLKVM